MITLDELRIQMNHYGAKQVPFVFGVNYELDRCFFYTNPLDCHEIYFDINGVRNPIPSSNEQISYPVSFQRMPISYPEYREKFDLAYAGLQRGDSFLLNLTVATPISTNLSLFEIFKRSNAKYKLYIPNEFVCFSPESFVKIKNGTIAGYPMKGTIDATIPDAENKILNDYKESAEHYTIVDLIRNDLNRIANNTQVKRFRYIDQLETNNGPILQVSSQIDAKLSSNYLQALGDIFIDMLPAGSISGAPKKSTVEIIANAEKERRDFYTGVVGYFDGESLDSGVLIRFIETRDGNLFFRSGGGITINSNPQDEYNEVIEKVYLPF